MAGSGAIEQQEEKENLPIKTSMRGHGLGKYMPFCGKTTISDFRAAI